MHNNSHIKDIITAVILNFVIDTSLILALYKNEQTKKASISHGFFTVLKKKSSIFLRFTRSWGSIPLKLMLIHKNNSNRKKWSIGDDSISPFSLQTSYIGEKLYGVVSSSVWEGNPEADDDPVILDRDC